MLVRVGEVEVKLLEMCLLRAQLVDRDVSRVSEVPHHREVLGRHLDAAVLALEAESPPGQGACQPVGVGGPHEGGRLAPQLLDGALRDSLAVRDDDDVVDGLLDLGQHVARDEQRAALRSEVAQEPAQPPDAVGVQAVGGLVEDDDARVPEQGGREPESLPHAHRVAACALARRGRDAHELEHLVHATGRDPGSVGKGQQVVAPGAPRVEVRRLERGPDDGEGVGDVVVATPLDGCGAGGRTDQPEEHPQGRRLAGAVRAEEAGDPAGNDVEVELVDGRQPAEPLRQPADLDPAPLRIGGRRGAARGGLCWSGGRRGCHNASFKAPKGDFWCASNSTTPLRLP